eukprot:Opistho-2@36189
MTDRDEIVYCARLAEQCERFDEMVDYMKRIARLHTDLSIEERNLLSVAFKNALSPRRAAWRITAGIESKEDSKGSEKRLSYAAAYRKKLEGELRASCNDALTVLSDDLIPSATTGESTVFYHKMKGDYYRYIAEFSAPTERKEASESALIAYKEASESAATDLPPTHPIRLGLALNFSVFYYEILQSPDRACQMAQSAFNDAMAELDSLPEDSQRESTMIMQLLRDNLTLWTSNYDGTGDEDGGR